MDSYKIIWKHSAEKDLRRIDKQHISRIVKPVADLSNNPSPSKHRKLLGTEVSYRIRIGNYRVVYQIDTKEKLIIIYHIRHRKDIYRK
jgi:mRNA interferase RelE/StbE